MDRTEPTLPNDMLVEIANRLDIGEILKNIMDKQDHPLLSFIDRGNLVNRLLSMPKYQLFDLLPIFSKYEGYDLDKYDREAVICHRKLDHRHSFTKHYPWIANTDKCECEIFDLDRDFLENPKDTNEKFDGLIRAVNIGYEPTPSTLMQYEDACIRTYTFHTSSRLVNALIVITLLEQYLIHKNIPENPHILKRFRDYLSRWVGETTVKNLFG